MTTKAPTSPNRLGWRQRLRPSSLGLPVLVLVTVMMLFIGVFIGVFAGRPGDLGVLLVLVAAGLVALVLGLVSPSAALVYLLLTTFFRLSITSGPLPLDPFMIAFGLLLLTVAIRLFRGRDRYALIGPLEVAMVLYVAVNALSMFTTHRYAATYPLDDTPIDVSRFFVIGVVIPLACVVVGIASFGHERGMRVIVLAVMAFAAYSAFGSIMTFHGPQALVFPRFMVTDPGWSGRAVGVFRQPVANGLALTLGYLCALLMASRRSEPRWLRLVSALLAVATLYGVYLTHTRGVWLALGVVVLLGALLARGWRSGFVATGVLVVSAIAVNWTEFTSSDRSGGGVGSASELEDRLNMIATAAWAIEREPWFGWGLGRFAAVNTLHHQQATPSVPWERGYAISSHLDILGITDRARAARWGVLPAPPRSVGLRASAGGPRAPALEHVRRPGGGAGRAVLRVLAGDRADRRPAVLRLPQYRRDDADRGRHRVRETNPQDRGMRRRQAVWASTSTTTRGGVASYVRAMQGTPLWERWSVRHVATHQDGSVLQRVVRFASGAATFWLLLITRRPALVHLHTASRGSFARKSMLAWSARARGVPVVLHVHGGGFADFHDGLPRPLRRYVRATLEICRRGRRAWALVGGEAAARSHRLPGWSSCPTRSRRGQRAERAATTEVCVLFLGRLCDDKGVHLLLEAWPPVLAGLPAGTKGRLVLAGDGEVDRFRADAVARGVAGSVDLPGWVSSEEVDELLDDADVLVLPSRWEGHPMSVLEAMARGVPVVATAVGGVPDLVDERSGILIHPDDVEV